MAEIKLRKTFGYPDRKVGIADAVAWECDGSDYDSGSVETAARTARQTSELVGRLAEKLHDRGLLSNDEVIEVLGGCWEFV